MAYQTRAYDQPNTGGFPADPVAVVVASGTHDVSRLVHLLSRGLIEHVQVGKQLQQQTRRRNGGRAALALLREHGGPDLTMTEPDTINDHGAFWSLPDLVVRACPDSHIKAASPSGSLRVTPEVARELADRLWAAADYAERVKADQVLSSPLGNWKACTDPEHTAPVDDTLETCPEHDVQLVTVNAAGYEVVTGG